jgi:serine/threonine protein kinase
VHALGDGHRDLKECDDARRAGEDSRLAGSFAFGRVIASDARMKEDAVGDVMGGFELLEIVAYGGMAVVWKARAADGELVAVKRLLPNLERDPMFVKLFLEEARALATLSHRHIVGLRGSGEVRPGQHFLAMQWVEGVDLTHFVDWHCSRERPTPWRLVARIGAHLLRGLAAAHDRIDASGVHSPVYHRDVSPGNVLIDVSGVARVADFGVARAMDRASMTQPGIVKGKVGYTSPEALRGAPPTVQSDLWSVGVVLWEAFTAERLFAAKGVAELLGKLKAPVPSLIEARPDLPKGIAELVHSFLEKSPDMRPVSASESAAWLEARLDEESSGEPILSLAVRQTVQTPST